MWEYCTYQTHHGTQFLDITVEKLNKFGKKGWELVTVVMLNNMVTYYFKRKK